MDPPWSQHAPVKVWEGHRPTTEETQTRYAPATDSTLTQHVFPMEALWTHLGSPMDPPWTHHDGSTTEARRRYHVDTMKASRAHPGHTERPRKHHGPTMEPTRPREGMGGTLWRHPEPAM